MRGDLDRLRDVLEALDAIERHAPLDQAHFNANELVQVWCMHQLLLLGEAVAHVSETVRIAHPEVLWRQIVGMRNAIVHGYFQVDADEVWQVLVRDLAPLRHAIEAIVASWPAEDDAP